MRTSAFVNKILRACPSLTIPAVLDEINSALNTIFDRPLSIMRVYDESTGYDPVLSTSNGVLGYTSDDIDTEESIAYIGRIYQSAGDPSSSVDVRVQTAGRTLSGSPIKINFTEDPGSGIYYVETYKRPTEILSIKNPEYIPFAEEFINKYLYELVVANFELQAHGRSARMERFEQNALVDLYGKLNENSNQVSYSMYRYY